MYLKFDQFGTCTTFCSNQNNSSNLCIFSSQLLFKILDQQLLFQTGDSLVVLDGLFAERKWLINIPVSISQGPFVVGALSTIQMTLMILDQASFGIAKLDAPHSHAVLLAFFDGFLFAR